MAVNHASAVAMAARHGRVLMMHLVLAFFIIGLAGAYWFLVKAPAETAKVRDGALNKLEQTESQLAAHVAVMETLAATLLNNVRENGSGNLGSALEGLPNIATESTGLLAASWWPDAAASRPQYWYRENERWQAHTVDRSEVIRSVRQKVWFALAQELGNGRCLWSHREREAVTGELVMSCSRSFFDSKGRQLGVVRASFRRSQLMPLFPGVGSGEPVMLISRDGELIGGNLDGFSGLRSLADVGQQQRELAPLMTSLYDASRDALEQRINRQDFPQDWVSKARVETGADVAELRSQIAAAWQTDTYAPTDVCSGSQCAYSASVRNTPWFLVSVMRIPAPLDIANNQFAAHMPLIIFSGLVLVGALFSYLLTASMFLRPLARLVSPLARSDVGPAFDERIGGVWGQLSTHINELANRIQQLRGEALTKTSTTLPTIPVFKTPSSLHALPVASLRVRADGKISEINPLASDTLGLSVEADADLTPLLRLANGQSYSMSELPGEWRGELCQVDLDEGDAVFAVSTDINAVTNERTVILTPAVLPARNAALASSSAAEKPSASGQKASPHTQVRLAIGALTSPVHWLSLRVTPELVSPALTEPDAKKQFEEQLLARIEERLESGEALIRWNREHYIIVGSPSISVERAEALRNDLQRTLIFLANERVRLKAVTARFSVRPRMSSEDFDATVFAAQNPSRGAEKEGKRTSYDSATLTRLITQGFSQKRFQLITEHGAHPGSRDSAPQVFRVLPHLEDDEGFWMGAEAYVPALRQLDRHGEHDTWLVEAVHSALHALNADRPEQVLLPLSAKALGSTRYNTAEKLTALARDPEMTDTRIFVIVNHDECVEDDVDLMSTRHLIHSLGCHMAISNVSLDTQAMAQLERIRPDMMIVRESLVLAAEESPTIGIGLESLMRAGEKLKCLTVLPAINSDRGTQLVDKLRPTLAFGSSIGKPSPLPFRAVA